jgi:hypothetical protein
MYITKANVLYADTKYISNLNFLIKVYFYKNEFWKWEKSKIDSDMLKFTKCKRSSAEVCSYNLPK